MQSAETIFNQTRYLATSKSTPFRSDGDLKRTLFLTTRANERLNKDIFIDVSGYIFQLGNNEGIHRLTLLAEGKMFRKMTSEDGAERIRVLTGDETVQNLGLEKLIAFQKAYFAINHKEHLNIQLEEGLLRNTLTDRLNDLIKTEYLS